MPEFAQFLVNEGINSISFNADALLKGIENMTAAEEKTVKASDDYVLPPDEMVAIARDNTYISPAPVVNWEVTGGSEETEEFLK